MRATATAGESTYAGIVRLVTATQVVVIVPRLNLELLRDQAMLLVPQERWADTIVDLPGNLQGHSYRDIFRGGAWPTPGASLSVGEVLRHFPVGVLVGGRLQ
jgi:(1->4)-alpha-D-glucan 1-alpha-D-glucosylmutase